MGFFRKEPEKPDYNEIEFSKIDKYMNFVLREKMGGFNKTITDTIAAMTLQKEDIIHELRMLHKKSLMNPNIPQREIQIMAGNRDAYVHRISHFVNAIEFPKGYLEMYEYCVRFSVQLEQLGKELQKNMFVLNHFFESEIKQVNKMLTNIEKKIIDIRVLFERNNIEVLKDIQNKIRLRGVNDFKIADLRQKIAEQRGHITNYDDKIKRLNDRIATITTGTDYRALQSFTDEKEQTDAEMTAAFKEFQSLFAEIDTALRKYYYRNPDRKILKEYFDNALEAFLNDSRLELDEILGQLRQLIEENAIDLKDKKRENTLDAIKKLNVGFLREKQSLLRKLHEQKQHLQAKITHNSASLNLSEQQYWIKNTEDRIKDHEKEIAKYDAEIARILEKNKAIMEGIHQDLEKIVGEHVLIIEDKKE